jgi:hypothetical protein
MKFISSSYDPEKGTSSVVMQHLGKKFEGTAKIHPDEFERKSEFAGCNYAEIRATIKALKYERQIAKNKSDEALDFVKSCEGYSKFDKDSPSAKAMYRQLNQRIKRVNDLADEINDLYRLLDVSIRRRDIILKAYNKKQSKKEN